MSYHNEVVEATDTSSSNSNSSYEKTYVVSVFSDGTGNKYQFDSSGLVGEIIGLKEGSTYKFDQSDVSNINHPFSFSITSNGTHGGGEEFSSIVQKFGTAGNEGAYTLITPTLSSPDLYYFCLNHSGMGGEVRPSQLLNSSSNEVFAANDSSTVFEAIGNYASFTIASSNVDTWTIAASAIGNDSISGFKRIEFNDGVLALDVDAGDTAGQAYRLYQAAFARTPDMPGVSYHMNDMEANGLALVNVANNFMASPEFKTQYGAAPSDDDFINLLYENVLSRTPGDSEVSWYKDQFDTGAMTRAAALIGFAESPENVALVAPEIDDGIWLAS